MTSGVGVLMASLWLAMQLFTVCVVFIVLDGISNMEASHLTVLLTATGDMLWPCVLISLHMPWSIVRLICHTQAT